MVANKIFTKARLLLIIIALGSCAGQPYKWIKKGIVPKSKSLNITFREKGKSLKLLYTGCGGLAIDDGGDVIMTDPFYSNQLFFNIMLKKIWTKPEAVEMGLKLLQNAGISAHAKKHVFIAHSHYDHLMDLPYLLEKEWISANDKIYGSTTTFNILKKFLPSDSSFVSLEPVTYFPKNDFKTTGSWIYISNNTRILPIQSDHAPHFLNVELMKGDVGEGGISHFNSSLDKSSASHWKDGGIYSFLIDYLEGDQVNLRIFIQSSSGKSPAGFPPLLELKNKKVDLAFIGVASSHNVKDYPASLLELISPSKTILIHWEDFFRPYGEEVRTVRMTNFNRFFKRLKKVYEVKDLQEIKDEVIMPEPGTVINVSY